MAAAAAAVAVVPVACETDVVGAARNPVEIRLEQLVAIEARIRALTDSDLKFWYQHVSARLHGCRVRKNAAKL